MLLSLAPCVRACHASDMLVLLDLRADRYMSLPSTHARLVEGNNEPTRLVVEDPIVAQALCRRGVVTSNPNTIGARESAPQPKGLAISVTPPGYLGALAAALWAQHVVRTGALDEAFANITQRKNARQNIVSRNSLEAECLIFASVKPWLPLTLLCLADSLALTRYLVGAGFSAECVIGVKVHPFMAHAWCAFEGAVLNDDATACESFSPIARV